MGSIESLERTQDNFMQIPEFMNTPAGNSELLPEEFEFMADYWEWSEKYEYLARVPEELLGLFSPFCKRFHHIEETPEYFMDRALEQFFGYYWFCDPMPAFDPNKVDYPKWIDQKSTIVKIRNCWRGILKVLKNRRNISLSVAELGYCSFEHVKESWKAG